MAIELPSPPRPLVSGKKELRFPPYRIAELQKNRLRMSIHDEKPEKLRLLVTHVVEAEGPVHLDVLTERIRKHYGAGHAGKQIQAAITNAAKAESRVGRLFWRGDFLDASQQPVRPEPRGPAQDGSVRNIEHIWEGEIEAGVLQVVEIAFGISRDDAVVAAARAFGYDRVGSKIRETIQQVVDRLITKGEIAETPAGLTTPS
jgi:hypothetical protein